MDKKILQEIANDPLSYIPANSNIIDVYEEPILTPLQISIIHNKINALKTDFEILLHDLQNLEKLPY